MRPQGPTFWLLDGQTGWRTAEFKTDQPQHISVGDVSGIRLAANPNGPLALTTEIMGGLTLPRGMAFDHNGNLYILDRAEARIKRFEPRQERFVNLATVGGIGSEARQFDQPRNIAIAARNLHVADTGNGRVQVFDLKTLALRYVWSAGSDGQGWEPYDVTVQGDNVYILDRRHGRVYVHRPGTDFLRLIVNEQNAADQWTRVVVDRRERIYVLVDPDLAIQAEAKVTPKDGPASSYLEIYDHRGKRVGNALDAGDVHDHIDTPLIRLDHRGRFHLPAMLVGSGLLRAEDFLDFGCLLLKLKQPVDPISKYLRAKFSSRTQALIDGYDEVEKPSSEIMSAICDGLNRLLQWDMLHTEEAFNALQLSASARRVIRSGPSGRVLIHLNRLQLEIAYPNELAAGCWLWRYGPLAQAKPPPIDKPLTLYPISIRGGLIFDDAGNRAKVAAAEPAGPKLFATEGVWYSDALDSKVYNCQWHRVELALSVLPAGSRIVVRTYTDNQLRSNDDIRNLPDHLWATNQIIAGKMQPPPAGVEEPQPSKKDFLILSQEGQYLWLKITLIGDGFGTPAIEAIQVDYPRQSYLDDLPAIYSADEASRDFLERFLSIFQTEWDGLERSIEGMARYFDPEAVPDQAALTYLAGWLALPLEGVWRFEQQRALLTAAPQIIPKRGTIEGLRRYIQIYLQNMTGLAPKDQGGYPQIVEGYRERQFMMLSTPDVANLGQGAPLWGPSFVGRLQLDVFAQEGQVRLVSTGDPERDLFHQFAHRFRVFIPASWVKTEDDEQMLRRALDEEKPAHTKYELCLVEPRFRVGLQSTIGLDTIIGSYPSARLACQPQPDAAPSRPPRQRLGYDTVLGGFEADMGGIHLKPSTRVGVDTILS